MVALDLDNTIICYANAFAAAASEAGLDLSGVKGAHGKEAVKEAALLAGGNALWTKIQGLAYGKNICEALPFPGVQEFFRKAAAGGIPLTIVSHKTQYAAAFPEIDLRTAATDWLGAHGFVSNTGVTTYFCDSREEKVAVLRSLGCSGLLDDLPEVFRTPGFPSTTRFVLFDPAETFSTWSDTPRVRSWAEASDLLLEDG